MYYLPVYLIIKILIFSVIYNIPMLFNIVD